MQTNSQQLQHPMQKAANYMFDPGEGESISHHTVFSFHREQLESCLLLQRTASLVGFCGEDLQSEGEDLLSWASSSLAQFSH